jgi:hypothetical protein
MSTEGGGILFFTNFVLYKKEFDGFQRQIISEVGGNDVMFGSSIGPAIDPIITD